MKLDHDGVQISMSEYYQRMLKMEGRGPVTLERCTICRVYRAPNSCRTCRTTFRLEWGASIIAVLIIALVLAQ
jgi:hypothetical protein